MKYAILYLVIIMSINLNAQEYKKQDELNDMEKCLYKLAIDTLKHKVTNLTEENIIDNFYFLRKDNQVMIQVDLKNVESMVPRVQLHTKYIENNFSECKRENWQIVKADFFESGKYRMNPAMNYVNYFDAHDYYGSTKAAEVRKNGKWGFINETGKIIIPFEYDSMLIHIFGIIALKDKQWKIISLNSGRTSESFDYISTSAPAVRRDGYDIPFTYVRRDGKAGLINSDLKIKVPLIYEVVGVYQNTYIVGIRSGKMVLIDHLSGKELTPLIYDELDFDGDGFETVIKKDGKIIKGRIDMEGKEVK